MTLSGVFWPWFKDILPISDFPFNVLFKCKGTTTFGLLGGHTAASHSFPSLTTRALSFQRPLLSWSAHRRLVSWPPKGRGPGFPLPQLLGPLARSQEWAGKCSFPWDECSAHHLRQRFALCKASILYHPAHCKICSLGILSQSKNEIDLCHQNSAAAFCRPGNEEKLEYAWHRSQIEVIWRILSKSERRFGS